MAQDKQNQKNSNKLYDQWEKWWHKKNNLTWIGKRMLRAKQKALGEVLPLIKPARIIDVGCGSGHLLVSFKKIGSKIGAEVIGIDVSKKAVEICQSQGLPVVHKKLEEVDEQYGLVFSDGMLEHFLNFEPYVKLMTKISSRYVLIFQTDHESFLGKTSVYLAELLRDYKELFEYNYRMRDFIAAFEKYGFKLILEKKIFGGVFKMLLFERSK